MIDWRPELRRAVLYVVGDVLNPVVLTLVRRHRFGRFTMLDHYGRRSGRLFSTPVEARSMPGGGIVIPLTWANKPIGFETCEPLARALSTGAASRACSCSRS